MATGGLRVPARSSGVRRHFKNLPGDGATGRAPGSGQTGSAHGDHLKIEVAGLGLCRTL